MVLPVVLVVVVPVLRYRYLEVPVPVPVQSTRQYWYQYWYTEGTSFGTVFQYNFSWSKFTHFGHTTNKILGDKATILVHDFDHTTS